MKQFLFNESGCCTNPNIFFDIHTLLPNFKRQLIIHTAYSEQLQLWSAGYNYFFGSACGGGCCVSFTNKYNRRTFFKTEKEAAIKEINFFLESQSTPPSAKAVLTEHLKKMQSEQLCLF